MSTDTLPSTAVRPDEPITPARVASDGADPTWTRTALIGLLVATAALYLWDLGASGCANSF